MDQLQLLLLCLAGWLNRNQPHLSEYLQEEIRVLKEQLGKRPRLNDDQRLRLTVKASRINPKGLKGLTKAQRQTGLFRVLLAVISTVIMVLIIYTLTRDKIHEIAMLKLIGARNRVIVSLILQEALLIGLQAYGLAAWLGQFAFPKFPRLVVIETRELVALARVVVGISIVASLLGIWKAMRVEPNKVLS